MAGRGSRYANRGFNIPKPLIEVAGKPMLTWALQSVFQLSASRYIFIALRAHEEHFQISRTLKEYCQHNSELVVLDQVTDGQLCTVLAAKHLFNPEEDVLIASSDTLVEGNIGHEISATSWDGIISVADLPGDHWSFAKTNDNGLVVDVAEKVRISNNASTGLYYFRRAIDLVEFGEKLISNNERTRGEFFVIPVYKKMIVAGMSIGISRAHRMWDMGTPEAKAAFEKYLEDKS